MERHTKPRRQESTQQCQKGAWKLWILAPFKREVSFRKLMLWDKSDLRRYHHPANNWCESLRFFDRTSTKHQFPEAPHLAELSDLTAMMSTTSSIHATTKRSIAEKYDSHVGFWGVQDGCRSRKSPISIARQEGGEGSDEGSTYRSAARTKLAINRKRRTGYRTSEIMRSDNFFTKTTSEWQKNNGGHRSDKIIACHVMTLFGNERQHSELILRVNEAER